jgi:hypothetical protein
MDFHPLYKAGQGNRHLLFNRARMLIHGDFALRTSLALRRGKSLRSTRRANEKTFCQLNLLLHNSSFIDSHDYYFNGSCPIPLDISLWQDYSQ